MTPSNFLLIRGLARESGHWGDFISQLENQDYCKKAYTLDLPGTGVYHKISSPLSIAENSEFLISQLKSRKWVEDKIVIVAVSLGAMVAMEMVSKYPKYFKKAFLLNTSFAGLSPVHHRLQLKSLKNFYHILRTKDPERREEEVLKMVSNRQDLRDKVKVQWAEISQQRPVFGANFLRQLIAASRYRLPQQQPSVEMVILASLADNMVDPRCSRALAEKWNLPIETNDLAGHELALDDPQWVLEKIKEYC